MIEGHGNDRYNYGDKIEIDFSSNIAFNNRSELIIDNMKESLGAIQNYPDPKAKVLCKKLALHHSVKSENIMVVNGSAEAFYMLAHFLSGPTAKTLIFTPSFAEYEDSCRLYRHDISYLALDSFEQVDYSNYSSVWIGTPNNPNGYRVGISKILELSKSNPNTYFIVDRAYNELSASCESKEINHIPSNVIFINSLTKSFGIPGIRLGYVIATEKIIEILHSLRAPWSVNGLSLVVGEYIMDNYQALSVDSNEILNESNYLQKEISKIDGFSVTKSDCNFFLCEITNGRNASELHSYLIENYGILIRKASNFRGLTDRYFRLAAQNREQNSKLINALREWITL